MDPITILVVQKLVALKGSYNCVIAHLMNGQLVWRTMYSLSREVARLQWIKREVKGSLALTKIDNICARAKGQEDEDNLWTLCFAKILTKFISTDNGTSHVINAYLHRPSASFNELKQLHKELGSSHSHKKHKRHTTENGNDSGKVVGNSVESVDINKELSLGHVKFDQFKRQQSGSGNADGDQKLIILTLHSLALPLTLALATSSRPHKSITRFHDELDAILDYRFLALPCVFVGGIYVGALVPALLTCLQHISAIDLHHRTLSLLLHLSLDDDAKVDLVVDGLLSSAAPLTVAPSPPPSSLASSSSMLTRPPSEPSRAPSTPL
ncbi:hypothetical protein JHK86_000711 [Glycine max]|nr:hypothetical protein JHK86_000711 [Glycine max]